MNSLQRESAIKMDGELIQSLCPVMNCVCLYRGVNEPQNMGAWCRASVFGVFYVPK
ncbi:MAG: hypothetical protein JXR78_07110 [Victivallales bacterium]|nr:hypothetical protein [Victivallales bacterium]